MDQIQLRERRRSREAQAEHLAFVTKPPATFTPPAPVVQADEGYGLAVLDTPVFAGMGSEGVGFAINFESDEPLVCNPNRPVGETCESCQ